MYVLYISCIICLLCCKASAFVICAIKNYFTFTLHVIVLVDVRLQLAQYTVFVVGNRNSWEHDDEIMQLYEEMERHITCEKQRIEQKVSVFCVYSSSSSSSSTVAHVRRACATYI